MAASDYNHLLLIPTMAAGHMIPHGVFVVVNSFNDLEKDYVQLYKEATLFVKEGLDGGISLSLSSRFPIPFFTWMY